MILRKEKREKRHGALNFPSAQLSHNQRLQQMHIHFTLRLFSKGSEAEEPQPRHPLTATVVMVTIWKASLRSLH